ncbi:MAG TPA: hypothetical protein VFX49_17400, partial [Chloroflexota bacterium]|nr:hypothetical protein [Chloroflexota bacterium]
MNASAAASVTASPNGSTPRDGPQTMSTYGFIARLFWRFKGQFVVFTLLSILGWAFQLCMPFISRAFINTLTGNAP